MRLLLVFLSLIGLLTGCSQSSEDGEVVVKTPEQAASALEQTFSSAPVEVQQNIATVSDALRKREYEKAIVSLFTVQQSPAITLQQGMAVHNSAVMLEHELINAMERGDERAAQAYQLLKRMKRN